MQKFDFIDKFAKSHLFSSFLNFLGRMLPDESKTNLDFMLPNNARHLRLSYGFFEEGLKLMQELDGFSFEWETYWKKWVCIWGDLFHLFAVDWVVNPKNKLNLFPNLM